ncbi:MAG: phosphatidylserine decarboxylase family protein [Pirellulaceae bacterium]
MRIELLWGGVRRWYLRTFHRGYVERMRAARQGDPTGCPHEVLDPRDLKFYRNVCCCSWPPELDVHAWRDRLPFARAGLGELVMFVGLFSGLAVASWFIFWPLMAAPLLGILFVMWFFRNPRRDTPPDEGAVVSPADGVVVAIEHAEHDAYVGGPAVTIGIFLNVFDVHVNRMPVAARIIGLTYRPGKFLNALRAASARENEQLAIRIEDQSPPHRRMIIRQIAGAIARRIVCWLRPGDELVRGELLGMIKLGSRTELVLPHDERLEIVTKMGQRVRGGVSILARYRPIVPAPPAAP